MSKAIYVPIIKQATDYSCGAACLLSCLEYWKAWSGPEHYLYGSLGTTTEGTPGHGILKAAQGYGLTAFSKSGLSITDLQGYLTDGYTIILSVQSWGEDTKGWEDGHYVVLVDIEGDLVILMDPIMDVYRGLTVSQLMECWHDYGDDGEYDYQGAIIIKISNT